VNNQDIIDFFDRLAPDWDTHLIHDDAKIGAILNYAGITKEVSVLDVACGTGVLIQDYLARDVQRVVAVDISPRMIDIARSKFSDPRIELLNADIHTAAISGLFDRCVVYNAFPHFPNPQNLIRSLAGRLTPGGRLTVAHSMSRETVNAHHSGQASKISVGLMSETELSALFGTYFDTDTALSSEEMYIVSGIKRK
jgi:demethylmenaquinone methyltransferase/2-methoxy-6-polyprenyl-1,4-benzoquinol methylase